MKKLVMTGKTVEEAVDKALVELSIPRSQAQIRILQQPSRGLFGLIGMRQAKVEVEWVPDPVEQAKAFLEDVLRQMNLSQVRIEHEMINDRDHRLTLRGPHLGVLIGRHGTTLDSLQTLVNAVAHKYSATSLHIILDAEDYRHKREEALQHLAARLAQKAVRTGREVVLEPMPAHERKIIHSYLQNHPQVRTVSRGEEPRRCLVIIPR